MFSNYIKTAFRTIFRNKLFSALNILGLALAMSVGLLIISILVDQSSVDHFHKNKHNIYRITSKSQYMAFDSYAMATTATPLVEKLNTEYPGYVNDFVSIRRTFSGDVMSEHKTIPLSGHFVDPSFLNVFSFEVVTGTNHSLDNPHSLLLTESSVKKLFSDQKAIGQIVTIEPYGKFLITGIIQDPPRTSHLQFDMLGSFSTVKILENQEVLFPSINNWLSYSSNYIYLTLNAGISIDQIHAALNQISDEIYADNENLDVRFSLQPLLSISPGRDLSNQIGPIVSTEMIILLSIMALIIMGSAGFNYTNLTIARSLRRAKEIGIRKVMGGNRNQLIIQFITESVLVSLLAVILSTGFYIILKDLFMIIVPQEIQSILNLELTLTTLLAFAFFAIIVGIFAGIIPSVFLASLKPSAILKDHPTLIIFRFINLRKSLVVVQFTISLIFIIMASIAYQQYRYYINFDNGYNAEGIINISLKDNDGVALVTEFSKLPEIKDIALTSVIVNTGTRYNTWTGLTPDDSLLINQLWTDDRYLSVMEIPLLAGQDFQPESSSDVVLVNETLAIKLGFTNPYDAIGVQLRNQGKKYTILGVTSDFQYYRAIEPMGGVMIKFNPGRARYASLRYSSSNPNELLYKLENAWNVVDHEVHLYEANFFTDQLQESYSMLMKTAGIIGLLAILAISIACLGLLGMAVFMVETRIKEIGIRKVLGASEKGLVFLLSKGFIKLLLISSFISIVIMWLLVNQVLLPNMANKAIPGFLEFGSGVVLMLLLGALIIGTQTWQAAKSNPVDTLRNE